LLFVPNSRSSGETIVKKFAALVAFAIAAVTLAPAVHAQATPFTGKWEGTMIRQNPDGTEGNPQPVLFTLTQKGKVITGTGGPGGANPQQWPAEKGAVNAGKATFEIQQPNGGPLFKFTLSVVKGRLVGEGVANRDGAVLGKVKVDAGKAAAAAKK
jgi:hypothetical protein